MSGTILLVEDEFDDVVFVRNAFAKARILNPIQVVSDGEAALCYLEGEGRFADRAAHPFPILMLLDLMLPGKSGFEVLEWIKGHDRFKSLPVIVLSGSAELAQLNAAYGLGAQTFMRKPLRAEELPMLFSHLKGFRLVSTGEADSYIQNL